MLNFLKTAVPRSAQLEQPHLFFPPLSYIDLFHSRNRCFTAGIYIMLMMFSFRKISTDVKLI